MKKIAALVAGGALLATIGLGACTKTTATNELNTPQGKQAVAKVKACLIQGINPKGIIRCLAPPQNKVAFENCALSAVNDIAKRVKLENDLATCVVKYG